MSILAAVLIALLFTSIICVFLFAEYRAYRRGKDAWFWPTPKGQWLFHKLHLTGESRFTRGKQ